jgi:hypothetical protein
MRRPTAASKGPDKRSGADISVNKLNVSKFSCSARLLAFSKRRRPCRRRNYFHPGDELGQQESYVTHATTDNPALSFRALSRLS